MFDVWPTLGRALNIGRTTTYQLARTDRLPVPVIRIGRQFRVRRADLLTFLGIAEDGDGPGSSHPEPSDEHAPIPTSAN
jgi:excisionase family DNA binding protein